MEDDDISEEALSSAREGPAMNISKAMLDSMGGDNTQDGASSVSETPSGNDVTDSKDNVSPVPGVDLSEAEGRISSLEVTDEVLVSAREGPPGFIAESMLHARERNVSGETFVMESEDGTDKGITPTPTSTEVGEILVSEVMAKVQNELQNAMDLNKDVPSASNSTDENAIGREYGDLSVVPNAENPEDADLAEEAETNEVSVDKSEAEIEEHKSSHAAAIDDSCGTDVQEDERVESEKRDELDAMAELENEDVEQEKSETGQEENETEVEESETGPVENEAEQQENEAEQQENEAEQQENEAEPQKSETEQQEMEQQENEEALQEKEQEPQEAEIEQLEAETEHQDEETEQPEDETEQLEDETARQEAEIVEVTAVTEMETMLQPAVIVSTDVADIQESKPDESEEATLRHDGFRRRLSAAAEDTVKVAQLEETVAGLRKSLEESDDKISIRDMQIKMATEQLESTKSSMEDKVRRYEIQLSEVMGQLRQLKDASSVKSSSSEDAVMQGKIQTDIKTYQDQIKQDAVAICKLEERLDKVVKKNKEYQVEVKQLAKTVQDLKTERQALVLRIQQLELSGPQTPNEPPPTPKVLIQRPIKNDIASAEVVVLRQENLQLKMEVAENLRSIEGLRRDLVGAEARLSDMAGELSESQKEALEAAKADVNQKEAELSEVKGQLKELTDLMEQYKAEVVNLKDNLKEQKSLTEEYRGTVSDQSVQIKDLQNQLTASTKKTKEDANLQQSKVYQKKNSFQSEGHITKDLTALGSRCKGERHDETIHRQKEALAELRSRIKALEQIKPSPSTTQDQALSQIFMLKRELAELRAKQASQTLDQRHHIIRKIQNQVTEGQEEVTGSTEGHSHGNVRSPSPSIGLPAINKSLENKQRLTAVLKDANNTRPRIFQNGNEYPLEEKPRSPRSAWLEGPSPGEEPPGRGTPSIETDINFALFRHPAPPGGPRKDTARSTSRSRPRSATPLQERSIDDALSGRESYETLSSKRNQAEAELERSAHNETSRALELSEEIYLQTLKTLATQLNISDVPGVHSISHLPQDERSTVAGKRLEALQIMSTRVAALQERIDRKDQLLQGYESDLEKLRKAEQANQEMKSQVENLSAELRAKTDEGHYLRESLSRAREKLDQEARLNSAIKLKKDTDGMFASMVPNWIFSQICLTCRHTLQTSDKTFHLENEFSHKNPPKVRPSSASDEKKKKDQAEVLKKKNYEIKQLRTTLAQKDKELYDVKRRYTIRQDMQKSIHVPESPDISGHSSRRGSNKIRPPHLKLKQNKRQSQSSISFQNGIVEIQMDQSESALISQSQEPTITADQSEPLTAESQSEFTNDVIIDQSEDRNEVTDQSEERNEIIDQSEAVNENGMGHDYVIGDDDVIGQNDVPADGEIEEG